MEAREKRGRLPTFACVERKKQRGWVDQREPTQVRGQTRGVRIILEASSELENKTGYVRELRSKCVDRSLPPTKVVLGSLPLLLVVVLGGGGGIIGGLGCSDSGRGSASGCGNGGGGGGFGCVGQK